MTTTKKLFFIVFSLLTTTAVCAQTVKVKKENARIKGENIQGFEASLDGTAAEVNTAFIKFLKTLGKVKQSDGITVQEPIVNGNAYALPLLATVKDNGKTAVAWIGIKADEWPKGDAEKVNKELEKIIRDFGIKFYRDKIQLQIDESTRAVQAVEKQQQRFLTENKSLNTKLENNRREKLQLEKSLATNKTEHETLLKKIAQNKKAQDSVAIAADQIKKVVEMHKDRQKKVN